MKRIAILLGLVLAAGAALADQQKPSSRTSDERITAEVVSVDRDAKTITLRSSATALESTTLPVQGKAIATLKALAAGDTVTLACAAGKADVSAPSEVLLGQCAAVTTLSKSRAMTRSSANASPSASSGLDASPGLDVDVTSWSSSEGRIDFGKEPAAAPAAPPTGAKISAVIVSTDASAKTITVRDPGLLAADGTAAGRTDTKAETHDNLTLPVEGKAAASLKELKSGESVMLTCREGAAAPAGSSVGQHEDVAAAKGDAVAAADTGWSMAKAGRCAAVTDVAKARESEAKH